MDARLLLSSVLIFGACLEPPGFEGARDAETDSAPDVRKDAPSEIDATESPDTTETDDSGESFRRIAIVCDPADFPDIADALREYRKSQFGLDVVEEPEGFNLIVVGPGPAPNWLSQHSTPLISLDFNHSVPLGFVPGGAALRDSLNVTSFEFVPTAIVGLQTPPNGTVPIYGTQQSVRCSPTVDQEAQIARAEGDDCWSMVARDAGVNSAVLSFEHIDSWDEADQLLLAVAEWAIQP